MIVTTKHFGSGGKSVCGTSAKILYDRHSIAAVNCKNCMANRLYKAILAADRPCESGWSGEGGKRCQCPESLHRKIHGKRGRICWNPNGCGCQGFKSTARKQVAA